MCFSDNAYSIVVMITEIVILRIRIIFNFGILEKGGLCKKAINKDKNFKFFQDMILFEKYEQYNCFIILYN